MLIVLSVKFLSPNGDCIINLASVTISSFAIVGWVSCVIMSCSMLYSTFGFDTWL